MSDNLQAIIDRCERDLHAAAREVRPGDSYEYSTPPNWDTHHVDGEHLMNEPRRQKGTIKAVTAAGFIEALKQLGPKYTVDRAEGELPAWEFEPCVKLWSDPAQQQLVAVLNDATDGTPGWRDHRVVLDVPKTVEWQKWLGGQGMGNQLRFAEQIEWGQSELHEPAAAVMLTIAQTFEANVDVEFAQGSNLVNGGKQVTYKETVAATAGNAQTGTVTIPDVFTIAVAPFEGSDRFAVQCRLKYAIKDRKLAIGYSIVRPEEIERQAFDTAVGKVASELRITPIQGIA